MPEIDAANPHHLFFSDFGPRENWNGERTLDRKVFRVWATVVHNIAIQLSELRSPDPYRREFFEAASLVIDEIERSDLSSLRRLDQYLAGS